jgi:hypothetical protein
MRKKTKVIVIVSALLLVLPLTVFTIAEESGFFDSRSSAGDPWEECGYSLADLDNDGAVGLSDFHMWMNMWKEYKACEKDVSKCRVGCVDSMHGGTGDDNKKKEPEPIEDEDSETGTCSGTPTMDLSTNYDGNNNWSYTVSGDLTNGCQSVKEVNASVRNNAGTETVSIIMTVQDSSGSGVYCTTAMVPVSESGTFEASEDAVINCNVRTIKTKADTEGYEVE